jgi:hypothetical protein
MNPLTQALTAGAGATHTKGSHRQSNLMLGGVDCGGFQMDNRRIRQGKVEAVHDAGGM